MVFIFLVFNIMRYKKLIQAKVYVCWVYMLIYYYVLKDVMSR